MDELNFCSVCGTKLHKRLCGDEGMVQFCDNCNEFKFPTFNSAVSMVIFNKAKDKLLLIQQYGRKDNILVAGYINKGEIPQEALQREIREEVNLKAIDWDYNHSIYFEMSNTLIHNFIVVVEDEDFTIKENEVDKAEWFTIDDAGRYVKPNSLAKTFLTKALRDRGYI
ncbi:MAG: NUDIX domain-containing protein [Clostridia bacterium]|nr:NUDIX domain-containing protein [Clostridia bacterium]